MKENDPKNSLGDIKIFQKCPVCNEDFSNDDFALLSSDKNRFLIHIACKHCLHAFLASVRLRPQGTDVLALLSDLNREETAVFLQRDAVSTKDVLDAHNFLEKSSDHFVHYLDKMYE